MRGLASPHPFLGATLALVCLRFLSLVDNGYMHCVSLRGFLVVFDREMTSGLFPYTAHMLGLQWYMFCVSLRSV